MKKRILLVEDDTEIRKVIREFFVRKAGEELELVEAGDGNEGHFLLENEDWDLVLLDIMLPGVDGFSLCRTLRKRSDAPLIFLTARGREEDVLYGYDLGCDDYIVKPFSLATLLAKVEAILRRTNGMVQSERMTCGLITIEPRTYRVFSGEAEVELPPKEYEILLFLLRNKGMVCTREILLSRLWGYDYEGDARVLDNHIKKLRKALGVAGGQIKTVITKGYKLVERT